MCVLNIIKLTVWLGFVLLLLKIQHTEQKSLFRQQNHKQSSNRDIHKHWRPYFRRVTANDEEGGAARAAENKDSMEIFKYNHPVGFRHEELSGRTNSKNTRDQIMTDVHFDLVMQKTAVEPSRRKTSFINPIERDMQLKQLMEELVAKSRLVVGGFENKAEDGLIDSTDYLNDKLAPRKELLTLLLMRNGGEKEHAADIKDGVEIEHELKVEATKQTAHPNQETKLDADMQLIRKKPNQTVPEALVDSVYSTKRPIATPVKKLNIQDTVLESSVLHKNWLRLADEVQNLKKPAEIWNTSVSNNFESNDANVNTETAKDLELHNSTQAMEMKEITKNNELNSIANKEPFVVQDSTTVSNKNMELFNANRTTEMENIEKKKPEVHKLEDPLQANITKLHFDSSEIKDFESEKVQDVSKLYKIAPEIEKQQLNLVLEKPYILVKHTTGLKKDFTILNNEQDKEVEDIELITQKTPKNTEIGLSKEPTQVVLSEMHSVSSVKEDIDRERLQKLPKLESISINDKEVYAVEEKGENEETDFVIKDLEFFDSAHIEEKENIERNSTNLPKQTNTETEKSKKTLQSTLAAAYIKSAGIEDFPKKKVQNFTTLESATPYYTEMDSTTIENTDLKHTGSDSIKDMEYIEKSTQSIIWETKIETTTEPLQRISTQENSEVSDIWNVNDKMFQKLSKLESIKEPNKELTMFFEHDQNKELENIDKNMHKTRADTKTKISTKPLILNIKEVLTENSEDEEVNKKVQKFAGLESTTESCIEEKTTTVENNDLELMNNEQIKEIEYLKNNQNTTGEKEKEVSEKSFQASTTKMHTQNSEFSGISNIKALKLPKLDSNTESFKEIEYTTIVNKHLEFLNGEQPKEVENFKEKAQNTPNKRIRMEESIEKSDFQNTTNEKPQKHTKVESNTEISLESTKNHLKHVSSLYTTTESTKEFEASTSFNKLFEEIVLSPQKAVENFEQPMNAIKNIENVTSSGPLQANSTKIYFEIPEILNLTLKADKKLTKLNAKPNKHAIVEEFITYTTSEINPNMQHPEDVIAKHLNKTILKTQLDYLQVNAPSINRQEDVSENSGELVRHTHVLDSDPLELTENSNANPNADEDSVELSTTTKVILEKFGEKDLLKANSTTKEMEEITTEDHIKPAAALKNTNILDEIRDITSQKTSVLTALGIEKIVSGTVSNHEKSPSVILTTEEEGAKELENVKLPERIIEVAYGETVEDSVTKPEILHKTVSAKEALTTKETTSLPIVLSLQNSMEASITNEDSTFDATFIEAASTTGNNNTTASENDITEFFATLQDAENIEDAAAVSKNTTPAISNIGIRNQVKVVAKLPVLYNLSLTEADDAKKPNNEILSMSLSSLLEEGEQAEVTTLKSIQHDLTTEHDRPAHAIETITKTMLGNTDKESKKKNGISALGIKGLSPMHINENAGKTDNINNKSVEELSAVYTETENNGQASFEMVNETLFPSINGITDVDTKLKTKVDAMEKLIASEDISAQTKVGPSISKKPNTFDEISEEFENESAENFGERDSSYELNVFKEESSVNPEKVIKNDDFKLSLNTQILSEKNAKNQSKNGMETFTKSYKTSAVAQNLEVLDLKDEIPNMESDALAPKKDLEKLNSNTKTVLSTSIDQILISTTKKPVVLTLSMEKTTLDKEMPEYIKNAAELKTNVSGTKESLTYQINKSNSIQQSAVLKIEEDACVKNASQTMNSEKFVPLLATLIANHQELVGNASKTASLEETVSSLPTVAATNDNSVKVTASVETPVDKIKQPLLMATEDSEKLTPTKANTISELEQKLKFESTTQIIFTMANEKHQSELQKYEDKTNTKHRVEIISINTNANKTNAEDMQIPQDGDNNYYGSTQLKANAIEKIQEEVIATVNCVTATAAAAPVDNLMVLKSEQQNTRPTIKTIAVDDDDDDDDFKTNENNMKFIAAGAAVNDVDDYRYAANGNHKQNHDDDDMSTELKLVTWQTYNDNNIKGYRFKEHLTAKKQQQQQQTLESIEAGVHDAEVDDEVSSQQQQASADEKLDSAAVAENENDDNDDDTDAELAYDDNDNADDDYDDDTAAYTNTAQEVVDRDIVLDDVRQKHDDIDNNAHGNQNTPTVEMAHTKTAANGQRLGFADSTQYSGNKHILSQSEEKLEDEHVSSSDSSWWNTLNYAEIRNFLNTIFDAAKDGFYGELARQARVEKNEDINLKGTNL